eukprot:8152589-Pyramimonas_sp.AAC.1
MDQSTRSVECRRAPLNTRLRHARLRHARLRHRALWQQRVGERSGMTCDVLRRVATCCDVLRRVATC